MEETRTYPLDEDDSWHRTQHEDRNYEAAVKIEDEVPFHVPRD